jgi:hypothetical protein
MRTGQRDDEPKSLRGEFEALMAAVEGVEHRVKELEAWIPKFIEKAFQGNLSDQERQVIARKLIEHEGLIASPGRLFSVSGEARTIPWR